MRIAAVAIFALLTLAACSQEPSPRAEPLAHEAPAPAGPAASHPTPPPSSAEELPPLVALGVQAVRRAGELDPDLVLDRAKIDPRAGRHVFWFTDTNSARTVKVVVIPGFPSERWPVEEHDTQAISERRQEGMRSPVQSIRLTPPGRSSVTIWSSCPPRMFVIISSYGASDRPRRVDCDEVGGSPRVVTISNSYEQPLTPDGRPWMPGVLVEELPW